MKRKYNHKKTVNTRRKKLKRVLIVPSGDNKTTKGSDDPPFPGNKLKIIQARGIKGNRKALIIKKANKHGE